MPSRIPSSLRPAGIGPLVVAAALVASACGADDSGDQTTPADPAAAFPGVDFVADFEDPGASPNGIAGAAPWESVRGRDQSARLVRDEKTVRSGRYSGRFTVRSGDQADPAPDSGERLNAIWYSSREQAGEVHWVGFSLRLEPGFTSTPANGLGQRWTIAWQLHGADRPEPAPRGDPGLVGVRPNIALSIGDDGYSLDISGGVITNYLGSGAVRTPGQDLRDAGASRGLNAGRWQDILIGFRLSPGAAGWTELWRRVEGERRFRRAVARVRGPNVYVYEPEPGAPGAGERGQFAMPAYEVIGLYRNKYGRPGGEGVREPGEAYTAPEDLTQTLWYDNVARGDSKAALLRYFARVVRPAAPG